MPATTALKRVLTQQTLRELADSGSFARGESYFASGQVMSLVEHAGKLTATVQGTDEYLVKLFPDGDTLASDCTCPMGADGVFCKHCVAVGLAWLANEPNAATKKTNRKSEDAVVSLDDVRLWLGKQKPGELVAIILEQAASDAQLRDRLILQAARGAGKNANVATIRKAVDRATRTGGFVDYRASRDFFLGVDQVVDSIAALLKQGLAVEVIELAEHALGKVEQASRQMDDSAGYLGMILSRLQDIHLLACQKAKPEPEELARRLFEWELQTPLDTFYGAVNTYAEVLGDRGLAAYRHCAETAWARVPPIRPGENDTEHFGRNYRLKNIMEDLARQSGDLDALVSLKARDLSSAYAFLQIAEIYRDAQDYDRALDWAERGVKAFPAQTDFRLLEFLADEYYRRKRHDDAMQLIWTGFSDNARLDTFQKLKDHADLIGLWIEWREKALGFVRAGIERKKKLAARKPERGWGWNFAVPDHSLLVEIFLWENDVEAAWREAQMGGCGDHWWMQLAEKRENNFPADAIPVYQKEVENLLNQKNHAGYAGAVKMLRRIQVLMARLPGSDFAAYLATVRTLHKAKRNFIKLAEPL